MKHGRRIAVIRLGYVGLPVAVSFARSGVAVEGFDIDASRVAELKDGTDRTRSTSMICVMCRWFLRPIRRL